MAARSTSTFAWLARAVGTPSNDQLETVTATGSDIAVFNSGCAATTGRPAEPAE